ncbi:MAG: ECF-type sigma factor [Thermoanaerobaculia bacterium]
MGVTDAEVTAFVEALGAEEGASLNELFSATYVVLRGLAHAQRVRWSGQETLGTTALVHEAYLKLSKQGAPRWRDRGHFFRVAAQAMRHILINYARRSRAVKRGGDDPHVPADTTSLLHESRIEELIALNEALTRLEHLSPRRARVVECRFFAGLDVAETAEALDISAVTVMRDWRRGRAWLYRELAARRGAPAGVSEP